MTDFIKFTYTSLKDNVWDFDLADQDQNPKHCL